MSNPARLLVLSGSAGAGTSTIARALARRVHAPVIRGRTPSAGTQHWLTGACRALADEEAAVASGLAAADELRGLSAALADGGTVVWDAGAADRCLRVLSTLASLDLLLRRLDPEDRLAMLALAEELAPLRRVLAEDGAWFAVVLAPAPGDVGRLRDAEAGFALLGLGIDQVVVNRVPSRSGGWPRRWTKRRRRRARAIGRTARAAGSRVVRVPLFAEDRVGRRRVMRHLDAVDVRTSVPRPTDGIVIDEPGGYMWQLPIGAAARRDVRLGVIDADAILVLDGLVRLLPLPSVLARCRITRAHIDGQDLMVHGQPDPAQWRGAP